MASICRVESLEFHSHPDLVRRSAPVFRPQRQGGGPETLNLISIIPSLLLSPLTLAPGWISALISLQSSSCSWNWDSVLFPELHGWISQPSQELSRCWVDTAATWQALISPAPRQQVPYPGIRVWTYPALDQAQECHPVCKNQSLKLVSFLQTLFLPCPGSSSPRVRATDTSVGSWVR